MFPDPFARLPLGTHRRAFLAALLSTAIVFVGMSAANAPLKTAAAPSGIVSWELARTVERSQEMLASWDETTRLHAALGLGLDYLFMIAYGLALAMGCSLVARGQDGRLRHVGVLLTWGALLAALLDAVENYALIRLLLGSERELWTTLAFGCAAIKFALVAVGVVYVLAVPMWVRVRAAP